MLKKQVAQQEPAPRILPLLAILAVIAGAILRIAQFARNRSLWFDEATLAESIVYRDLSTIFDPLAHAQAAPGGFVLLEKFIGSMFAYTDWGLRIVPLVAGVLALWIFYRFTRSALDPHRAFFACAFLALADYAIYYSSELKPYSSDLLLAVVLTYLASKLLSKASKRLHLQLGLTGALAIWISYPATFMLCGIWVTLVLNGRWKSKERVAPGFLTLTALWFLSAVAFYLTFVRRQANIAVLQRNPWSFAFLPTDDFGRAVIWLYERLQSLIQKPLTVLDWRIGTVALIIGAFSLWRTNRSLLALLALPAAFLIAASALSVYPVHGRLVLFMVPAAVVVLVSSTSVFQGRLGFLAWLGFGLLIVQPAHESLTSLWNPRTHEDIKQLFHSLESGWRSGDALVVDDVTRPVYHFYRDQRESLPAVTSYLAPRHLHKLRPAPRVWYLTTHRYPKDIDNIREFFQTRGEILFEQVAERSTKKMDGEAALFLVDSRLGTLEKVVTPGIAQWSGLLDGERWVQPTTIVSDLDMTLSPHDEFLAIELGGHHPFHKDPKSLALSVSVDGQSLPFQRRSGNKYVFSFRGTALKPGSVIDSIKLMAEPFVPSQMGRGSDERKLGVDLRSITIGPVGDFFFPKERCRFRNGTIDQENVKFRWSRKRSTLLLGPGEPPVLFMMAKHPDIQVRPVAVSIFVDSVPTHRLQLTDHSWTRVELAQEAMIESGQGHAVTIEVSRTFQPRATGQSEDTRELGVAVIKQSDLR